MKAAPPQALIEAIETYMTVGTLLGDHHLRGNQTHADVEEAFDQLGISLKVLLGTKELAAFVEAQRYLIVCIDNHVDDGVQGVPERSEARGNEERRMTRYG